MITAHGSLVGVEQEVIEVAHEIGGQFQALCRAGGVRVRPGASPGSHGGQVLSPAARIEHAGKAKEFLASPRRFRERQLTHRGQVVDMTHVVQCMLAEGALVKGE